MFNNTMLISAGCPHFRRATAHASRLVASPPPAPLTPPVPMSIGIPPPPLPLCARNSFLVQYDRKEPSTFSECCLETAELPT
jgi:hypothetical protein